ncbi:unnamed protein product [Enterobius vermicularis]|uniref:Pept_C1 domain-containing protein n=1 Tax=Enterobius vermicularis TaxID=51028 RepID=A0A0N4VJ07_ENTVE|nr:unnamed protein product [Enterobius vermicularis]
MLSPHNQVYDSLDVEEDVKHRFTKVGYSKRYTPLYKNPLPKFFLWENSIRIVRIRNQLTERGFPCNSCWAHTVIAAAEIMLSTELNQNIQLSDDELINCDQTNSGCQSGSTKRAFIRGYLKGYKLLQLYDPNGPCPVKSDVRLKQLFVFPKGDHNLMAHFLAFRGPIAVNVVWPYSMYTYSGFRIIRAYECEQSKHQQPAHAVLIVGYGEENGIKYWILRNSYGLSWGYRGHFRLERGADACQVESHASAATFGSQMSTATLFDLQQQQQQQWQQQYYR